MNTMCVSRDALLCGLDYAVWYYFDVFQLRKLSLREVGSLDRQQTASSLALEAGFEPEPGVSLW